MSAAAAGRMASRVGQAAGKAATKANEAGGSKGKDSILQKGAKRDPELYVRFRPFPSSFTIYLLMFTADPPYHHDWCLWHGWLLFWT